MSDDRERKMNEFIKSYKKMLHIDSDDETCKGMIEAFKASAFLELGDPYTEDVDRLESKLKDGDISFYNIHEAESDGTTRIDTLMNGEERAELEALERRVTERHLKGIGEYKKWKGQYKIVESEV